MIVLNTIEETHLTEVEDETESSQSQGLEEFASFTAVTRSGITRTLQFVLRVHQSLVWSQVDSTLDTMAYGLGRWTSLVWPKVS